MTHDYGPDWPLASLLVRARGRCDHCGGKFPAAQLDAHHKIPRRAGGSNHLSNLEALCSSCHAKAGPLAQARGEAMRRLLDPILAAKAQPPRRSLADALLERAASPPPPKSRLADAIRRLAEQR